MHGDHCFGLGAALALLDEAKAASQTDPARQRNHVYGPPGLAELLRASLLVTGQAQQLRLPIMVTELVCSPASAHPPRPLGEALDSRQRGAQGRQAARAAAAAVTQGSAAAGGGGGILVQRLAPRLVRETPELQAAVEAVADRVDRLEEIWYPPRSHPAARGGLRAGSGSDSEADLYSSMDEDLDEQNSPLGSNGAPGWRRPFVAAEGLFWELPGCAGVEVRAAQLQHRVACWGYVFRERQPAQEGAKRRKVVVMGDTVSSRAIAPLAAGCDVLSHEATFAAGMEDKARIAQHSTGRMAGAFAAAVGARQLVLTHFSARYREGPKELETRSNRQATQRELEQQSWAVTGLIREAAEAFRRPGAIFAASDFYTHHVPVTNSY
ncbi:hypothetical protein GPECTOR_19g321 [Gonium pectorale]|uniref:Metallo-beta-lactamase domain-containing protein n=1 Tax=Gonium pectorale TaxID=33097 RepID=A0A150GKI7_GONPE|nr:hypothetical protein GPECTOR_19g321 [Gonium pectorale]|eukprot:KXZ49870.1 hypothetical protein GPECTOR_19g321 [Gonium pectorale]